METNTLAGVPDMPTDAALRAAINTIIIRRYGMRGVKGFAADVGLPYDRVRDHLSGSTNWKVVDLLEYCRLLGVTFDDLYRVNEALPPEPMAMFRLDDAVAPATD